MLQLMVALPSTEGHFSHLSFALPVRVGSIQLNSPASPEMGCRSPLGLGGLSALAVDLSQFGCVPRVLPTAMCVGGPRDGDVSLTCQVASDPVAGVYWTLMDHSHSKHHITLVSFGRLRDQTY